jgi:GH15 family glucan-1,4-alpha-glucosidase
MRPQNPEIAVLMAPRYDAGRVRAIRRLLDERGTLRFSALPTGLFPAAANPRAPHTGYQAVWVRDNVHIANALFETGDRETAVRTVLALTGHFERQAPRFDAIIADPSLAASPRNRPHVKFSGSPLGEIPDWQHDQNDALGYFLWLFCRMARQGWIRAFPQYAAMLARFVRYFDAIQYWLDQDSGHWEEARKNAASSVGAVVAGLRELRELSRAEAAPADGPLDRLIQDGLGRLDEVLPSESIAPPSRARRYDAALLFLIYPLEVVEGLMAGRILEDVHRNLEGDFGIRRYLGDSFWCTNYRRNVRPEDRTRDYSEDIETRDRLLSPGEEAQWCIFDPILSVIWGRRHLATRDAASLARQTAHFNRALAQITPAFECPELWHWETMPDGSRVLETSEATPLAWTQANLLLALHHMEQTAAL